MAMAPVRSSNLMHFRSSRLDLTQNTAYMGPRRLLKEGSVTKAKSGRKLQLVLCNDIIVLLESRNLYRMVGCVSLEYPYAPDAIPKQPIPLHEARAKGGSSRDGSAFTITQDYKRHGDTIALKYAVDAFKDLHILTCLIYSEPHRLKKLRHGFGR